MKLLTMPVYVSVSYEEYEPHEYIELGDDCFVVKERTFNMSYVISDFKFMEEGNYFTIIHMKEDIIITPLTSEQIQEILSYEGR